MPFFTKSFRKDIQDELEYRRTPIANQGVYIPHVRVTSLVQTGEGVKFRGWPLKGFTLGISDINNINTLDDYFNTPMRNLTAIGTTYTGKKPVTVRIPTGGKKLPPPGVTDVSISSQSKGGFIFKAVITLKFYGKEQYDFIYQTMLRPGNQICIEYGHTRQLLGSSSPNDKDLDFFKTLDASSIDAFRENLYGNKPLKSTRNSGVVAGFVSNFSVKLNEQNEYEATIEILNSLEFLYTLNTEDTFLSYDRAENVTFTRDDPNDTVQRGTSTGAGAFSRSIKVNFGQLTGRDYDPEYDSMLRTLLSDAVSNPAYAKNILMPHEFKKKHHYQMMPGTATGHPMLEKINDHVANAQTRGGTGRGSAQDPFGVRELDADGNVLNPYEPGALLTTEELEVVDEESSVFVRAGHQGDSIVDEAAGKDAVNHFYVSLDYFFNRFVDKIISYSYSEIQGHYSNLKYDLASQLLIVHPGSTLTTFRGELANREGYIPGTTTQDQENYQNELAERVDAFESDQQIEIADSSFVGYWPELRSVDTTKVIINNENIYRFDLGPNGAFRGVPLERSLTETGYVTKGEELHFSEEDLEKYREQSRQEPIDPVSSGYFWMRRKKDYANIFESKAPNNSLLSLFRFNPLWASKNTYRAHSNPGEHSMNRGTMDGIYVNYSVIRNAFLNSQSVSEAINKVLNVVNQSTNNILRLKMRILPRSQPFPSTEKVFGEVQNETEVHNIVIYDESVMPPAGEIEKEAPYTFFRDNKSEAISYDFDFSLPSSVAATVMANTHEPIEATAAGGDPMNKALISSGYDVDANGNMIIENLISPKPPDNSALGVVEWPPKLSVSKPGLDLSTIGGFVEGVFAFLDKDRTLTQIQADKIAKGIEANEDYRDLLAYKELAPPVMKSKIVSDGLYNVIPANAKLNIKLQGLDGFRFGDMFVVNNILPKPYDHTNVFMVTGYKHSISSQEWITEVAGQMISSTLGHPSSMAAQMRALGVASHGGLTDPYAPTRNAEIITAVQGETVEHSEQEVAARQERGWTS